MGAFGTGPLSTTNHWWLIKLSQNSPQSPPVAIFSSNRLPLFCIRSLNIPVPIARYSIIRAALSDIKNTWRLEDAATRFTAIELSSP